MTEPKPPALRLLEGNRGHRRKNDREPKPKITADPPEPPAHLDGYARATWERLAPELHALGLLTVLDEPIFEAYCTAASVSRRAFDAWAADDFALTITSYRGSRVGHPALRILRAQSQLLLAVGKRFGMDPNSRPNLRGAAPDISDALDQPTRIGRFERNP